jgi:hypothetical protein
VSNKESSGECEIHVRVCQCFAISISNEFLGMIRNKIFNILLIKRNCEKNFLDYLSVHKGLIELIKNFVGRTNSRRNPIHENGVLIIFLFGIQERITDMRNVCVDTLDFRPLFCPFFMMSCVVTENVNSFNL